MLINAAHNRYVGRRAPAVWITYAPFAYMHVPGMFTIETRFFFKMKG